MTIPQLGSEPAIRPLEKLLPNALTAASAQPTKDEPVNTKVWAEWLKLEMHDNEIVALIEVCARYLMAIRDGAKPRWLSILGNSGTGKTHCARRIWGYNKRKTNWSKASFLPEEIYWPSFVSDLRAGDAYEKLRDMQRWPVLFLDDVCAERDTTGFASEQLNTLLGCREGKWTILTSNLLLGQIGKVDPRIADRMIRSPNQFIEVNTKSHALRTRHLAQGMPPKI